MTNQEIVIEEITNFVSAETMEDIGQIDLEHNLKHALNIDSLEEVEIVMNLEKKFNISVPDVEANDIKTVGDVVRLVEKTLKAA